MKRLGILAFIILAFVLHGYAMQQITPEAEDVAAAGGGTAPDAWQAECDDNAASSVVSADVGNDGRLVLGSGNPVNTDTVDNADGPSFELTDDRHAVESPADLTDTDYEDADFTIQFDMKSSTSFSANWERLWANTTGETQFMANTNSDTEITIYSGTTSEGTFAVDDMATGSWFTMRIVVETGAAKKIVVYQGANEAGLTEKSSEATAIDAPAFDAGFRFRFGGNTDVNKTRLHQIKDIKIWTTSIHPGE